MRETKMLLSKSAASGEADCSAIKKDNSLKPINRKMGAKRKKLISDCIVYALMIIVSIAVLMPLLWMLLTALKTDEQLRDFQASFWPTTLTLAQFKFGLFEYINYFDYFINSAILVALSVPALLFTTSLIAFGFAKFKVKEANVLFMLVLSVMMMPTQVTLITQYIIWSKLGMVDTYVPLVAGSYLGGNALCIFLMRQFFRGMPKDLDEAAVLDGCTVFGIFFKIYLPLVGPGLATIGILGFQATWNDYMGPLIYIQNYDLYPLSLALTLFKTERETYWGGMMAASTVTILPILIVFIAFQKFFTQSVVLSGLK